MSDRKGVRAVWVYSILTWLSFATERSRRSCAYRSYFWPSAQTVISE